MNKISSYIEWLFEKHQDTLYFRQLMIISFYQAFKGKKKKKKTNRKSKFDCFGNHLLQASWIPPKILKWAPSPLHPSPSTLPTHMRETEGRGEPSTSTLNHCQTKTLLTTKTFDEIYSSTLITTAISADEILTIFNLAQILGIKEHPIWKILTKKGFPVWQIQVKLKG